MATIGCLGDVVFQVSDRTVRTLSNMSLSGSAKFGTHQLHNGLSLIEYTGLDAEQISFDILLKRGLGIRNIMGEIDRIKDYMQSGATLSLVLGKTIFGKYRWCITSYSANVVNYDKYGNPSEVNLSLTLQEYVQ